jgi:phosphoglycolate/pyridoxal phosphate phosphatase family enzyme
MRRGTRIATAQPSELCRLVNRAEGFVFDLDGTIYLGDELIPGAAQVVKRLRRLGKKVAFLSNKAIATREDYADKLNRLGIPCSVEDVVNSSLVLARYLRRHHPGARVFPIAEKPLVEELQRHGLEICEDPERIQVVVVSWDRSFDYRKLNIAYSAALRGAVLVGTNPDRTCPMSGYRLPDAACMIAAVEACTERKVDPIVGKPSPIMLKEVLDLLGLQAGQCVVFGDRVETDMLMAARAGLTGVLVLTGVTRPEDVDSLPVRPDLILNSVADLLSALE